MNERQLVEACIRNERIAQRTLYEKYARRLFAIALRYMKNQDDAADVLQDAFVKVYKNIASFRFDCPLEAWLKRIVINTALKALQKNKRMGFQEDVEFYSNELSVEETGIQRLALEQLMELIHQLPDGCQTVFNLYAIEGYKHNEIAEMLGISEGTSKSQFSRAKSLLQEKLQEVKQQEL